MNHASPDDDTDEIRPRSNGYRRDKELMLTWILGISIPALFGITVMNAIDIAVIKARLELLSQHFGVPNK